MAPHALGDLPELCVGPAVGRNGAAEITVFKSAGTAIADLAAAILVWRQLVASSAHAGERLLGVDILDSALTKT